MAPRKLLVFWVVVFFLIALFLRRGSAENVNFYFPTFNFRNLTFLGDSHIRNGVVGLTRELTVPSSSAGAVIYNNPIRFFDPESNITASFSTKFTFSIANVNPSSYGTACRFSSRRTTGCSAAPAAIWNKFVAIEFDTKLDLHFNDPNDHHVGLDIESLNSIKTADPILQGVDLKSGSSITTWIDYKNDQEKLKVYLSYSNFKPEKPVLSVDIDLSEHLKEVMFVGFSASTEGSTEKHLVENWSFHTFGFVAKRPKLQPHNVSDTYVVVSPRIPVSGSGDKHHRRLGLGLGIAGPAFFCVALLVFGYVSVTKWMEVRRQKSFKAEVVAGPREFSYKELKSATGRFHSSRILGHGAFGTVYKAFFVSSGTISAVKRSKHSHEGKTEFLSELSIIACLRHKNLGELLLVYDFMPNGSLEKALYQEPGQSTLLDWSRRLNVAVGLASVLTYLHQECEQQVIHRDIKTGNVLLDGNLNAKLSDFGLAKLMDHDKSPVSTLTAGTMGYLAPEYLQYGKATEKTDTFSYGVVILEVACGRRPIEREPGSEKAVNLVDWVWGLHSKGKIIEAADKRLNGEFNVEEMRKLLLVGLSCANPDSAERPTMRRVLQILSNEAEVQAVPRVKPSLSFSSRLPLSLDEIVSDCDEEDCGSPTSSLREIIIH
ncbi:L-type lectin-domain containing receptor kinase S.7 [Pyrus ussuriensis x Pyrus communis]|uniref:non-specific serine/threonine protein kinase n=1 Tax=Pyrus ussuriensis x Pyrus communis TaxID=2448454 RepID=A0A5N5FM87_9ROSA|nr:L-type lectin-domain containing receptor kinase S.7 [Pyrus ussuriensis x Pyrus communis]KAB2616832.1 L-type lectin-domain containing receptor kinase S.7 [Pyrus ussuriensis x Pyrus communis]